MIRYLLYERAACGNLGPAPICMLIEEPLRKRFCFLVRIPAQLLMTHVIARARMWAPVLVREYYTGGLFQQSVAMASLLFVSTLRVPHLFNGEICFMVLS